MPQCELLETSPTLSVKQERWSDVIAEMRPIFPQHFRDLGVHDNLEPIADESRYEQLDKAGILFVLTARAEEKLVGYFVGFCMPHLHYLGAGPWAMTDMYYVLPEYRNGAGLALFRAFKQLAKDRGCRFAVTSCKLHQDHTELLEKLGAKWTDKTFVFDLEKPCQ